MHPDTKVLVEGPPPEVKCMARYKVIGVCARAATTKCLLSVSSVIVRASELKSELGPDSLDPLHLDLGWACGCKGEMKKTTGARVTGEGSQALPPATARLRLSQSVQGSRVFICK